MYTNSCPREIGQHKYVFENHLPQSVRAEMSARTLTGPGTLGYAPKEQLQGKASRRTDVYAVGAVMKYAATGAHPYMDDGAQVAMAAAQVLAGMSPLFEYVWVTWTINTVCGKRE